MGKTNNFANQCILEAAIRDWCMEEQAEAVYAIGEDKIEAIVVKISGSHYHI